MRQAVESLSKIDKFRLLRVAARHSFGSGLEPGDLVQDALVAALAGSRKCPSDVSVMVFLYGAIKSIANAKLASPWQGRRDSLNEEQDGRPKIDPASGREVVREAAAEQGLKMLFEAFDGNEVAQMVLLAVADGCSPAEVQQACGLTPVEYDSTRKAIRRMINRKFPDGWQP
jgi:DNA-directed RNA polymerase specialized sigma24 family protein